jgi:hypothetical protein
MWQVVSGIGVLQKFAICKWRQHPSPGDCKNPVTYSAGVTRPLSYARTTACARPEHLWNVMKKGLLAGDTLR